MKLIDITEGEVIQMRDLKPRPEQLAKNNPQDFKFKPGDYVRNIDRANTTGTIVEPFYLHEKGEAHIGTFDWFYHNDPEVNTYQEYIEALKTEIDPFSRWYSVHWDQDDFIGNQPEGTLQLTPKPGSTKLVR